MQSVQTRLTILYTAFLFSSLVYVIVGFALMKSGWKPVISDETSSDLLLGIFILMSVSMIALLVVLKKKKTAETEKGELSRQVLLFALAEVPSIFGLILFLLTGKFLHLMILCSLSLFAFVLVKPRTDS